MCGTVEIKRSCSQRAAPEPARSETNPLHELLRRQARRRGEVVDPAPSEQVWKHLRAGEPAMDHECEAEDAPAAVEGHSGGVLAPELESLYRPLHATRHVLDHLAVTGRAYRASRGGDRAPVASAKHCQRGRAHEPRGERGVDEAGSPWIAKQGCD